MSRIRVKRKLSEFIFYFRFLLKIKIFSSYNFLSTLLIHVLLNFHLILNQIDPPKYIKYLLHHRHHLFKAVI